MALLTFMSQGVGIGPVVAMLTVIHSMQFFLRTGFRESLTSFGSAIWSIIQGLCQGNGAAPPGWALLSSMMINIHKRLGRGVKLVAPISGAESTQAGVLYVDDTDLLQLGVDNHTRVLRPSHICQQQNGGPTADAIAHEDNTGQTPSDDDDDSVPTLPHLFPCTAESNDDDSSVESTDSLVDLEAMDQEPPLLLTRIQTLPPVVQHLVADTQASITNWGKLLCTYYLGTESSFFLFTIVCVH